MVPIYQVALSLYEQKKYFESILVFKEILKVDSNKDKIATCFYMSLCYKYLDMAEERIAILLESFKYDIPRAEICCEIGDYYTMLEKYMEAIFWYQTAIDLEPIETSEFYIADYRGYIPLIQLCLCYDRLGMVEKAIEYNEGAGKIYPFAESVTANRIYFSNLVRENLDEAIKQKQEILNTRERIDKKQQSGVSLLVPTNKAKYMDNIFENFDRMAYKKKEMIIILNNNQLLIDDYRKRASYYDNIQVYQLDESVTLGECLNYGIEHAKYNFIGKIDDDDYYGVNYLVDQMNVFVISDVAVTCKSKRFILFEKEDELWVFRGYGEDTIVPGGAGGTIIAKREVFDLISFHAVNVAEDEAFFQDCTALGFKIYSSNKFNYLYKRHSNQSEHTFTDADLFYKSAAKQISDTNEYIEYISV
ncbi:glycosyltransferase [Anaerosporobacter sp.]